MANVHSMTKVRSNKHLRLAKQAGVATRGSPDAGRRDNQRPIKLSGPLRTFLASERTVLIRVEAVLLCSATAMEATHPLNGPYYPDAVELAADLLRRQVVYLDDLLLDGILSEGY